MTKAGYIALPAGKRLSGHPRPAAILQVIAALDAQSAKVLENIKQTLNGNPAEPSQSDTLPAIPPKTNAAAAFVPQPLFGGHRRAEDDDTAVPVKSVSIQLHIQ